MTTLCKDAAGVEFRFFRPGAGEVLLAGDFSDWSPRLPMQREPYGWWTLQLTLEPGEYRFRYVADGEWYTDFASNGVEYGSHGWNSVLVVPERPAHAAVEREGARDVALRVA
jgi:1,4-alpha-glucan branching enzyme